MTDSHIKELKKLTLLVQQEQSLARQRFLEKLEQHSLKERCQEGDALYPLQYKRLNYGLGGRPIVSFEVPSNLPTSSFRAGQPILLFSLLEQERQQVQGVLHHLRDAVFEVMLRGEDEPDWLDQGKIGLELDFDEKTFREMLWALQELESPPLSQTVRLRDVLMGLETPLFLNAQSYPQTPGLNASQTAAVKQIMEAQDVALIHGPPGTGKTTTLIAAVGGVLELEQQVLVCAPSNTAVDLLTRKLAAAGHRVVRLGHPARMHEDIWQYTLDQQLEVHPNTPVLKRMRRELLDLRKGARRYHRQFGPAERQERQQLWQQVRSLRKEIRGLERQMSQGIIEQAQVIATTLVGATQSLIRDLRFSTLFIDEAAQALEPACWIPILKAGRVVLAGDHHQLPPTVLSPDCLELRHTLFEKLMQRHPQAGTLLDRQYRMHQDIMGFSNDWFYEGRLQADASVAERVLNPALAAGDEFNRPLIWIDTAGCGYEETQPPNSQSYYNPEEGNLLIQWLTQHLASPNFPQQAQEIGVIAPYRAQVEWLKNNFKLKPEPHQLEIETVDSFQGEERDLICLSLVRSNDRGEIGFLQDLRRINVAITRARKQIVLVGDSASLSQHPFYEALLEYAHHVKGWQSAWELIDF